MTHNAAKSASFFFQNCTLDSINDFFLFHYRRIVLFLLLSYVPCNCESWIFQFLIFFFFEGLCSYFCMNEYCILMAFIANGMAIHLDNARIFYLQYYFTHSAWNQTCESISILIISATTYLHSTAHHMIIEVSIKVMFNYYITSYDWCRQPISTLVINGHLKYGKGCSMESDWWVLMHWCGCMYWISWRDFLSFRNLVNITVNLKRDLALL